MAVIRITLESYSDFAEECKIPFGWHEVTSRVGNSIGLTLCFVLEAKRYLGGSVFSIVDELIESWEDDGIGTEEEKQKLIETIEKKFVDDPL